MNNLIVTTFVDPPIPTGFEWVANYAGDEPGDDGCMASGCGPTEEAAIANLVATHPRGTAGLDPDRLRDDRQDAENDPRNMDWED